MKKFAHSFIVVFSPDETNRNVISYQTSIEAALKTKYGIEANTGANPAWVYMIMFEIFPVLFHEHPDRRWHYDAKWVRAFNSEYLSTEDGTFNWLEIAIKQRAFIEYDGMKLVPVLGAQSRTLALFNSLVQLDTNRWETELCLDTFKPLKIAGSVYYVASIFQSCCSVPKMSPQLNILGLHEERRAVVSRFSCNIAMNYWEKFPRKMVSNLSSPFSKGSYSSTSLPNIYEKRSGSFLCLNSKLLYQKCDKPFKTMLRLANHALEEHEILLPGFQDSSRCWEGDCDGKIYAEVRTLKDHQVKFHRIKSPEN